MPLCVTLHAYRCGVDILILEVFSLLILFHQFRVLSCEKLRILVSVFTRNRQSLVDVEEVGRRRVG